MSSLSIFTSMTDPENRNDPWREALNCYDYFADEVQIVGQNWPEEFKWDYIGKVFQEGFEKCNSDWVMRMDIDYFIHEKYKKKLCMRIRMQRNKKLQEKVEIAEDQRMTLAQMTRRPESSSAADFKAQLIKGRPEFN